jgi:enolase
VETEITLQGGARGRAMAPAGASTGKDEAIDLRDGGDAFGGFDVQKAIGAVNGEISQLLEGKDATDQAGLDAAMIDLDGTPNKGRLGGNALVATSMAIAHAAAAARDMPLWRYLGEGRSDFHLPLPEIQIFGGGAHAGRRVDVQDFMIIAVGAPDYAQSLEWTAEVYRAAGRSTTTRKHSTFWCAQLSAPVIRRGRTLPFLWTSRPLTLVRMDVTRSPWTVGKWILTA